MATIIKRGKSFRFRTYEGYGMDGKQIEHTMTWTPPPNMTEKQAQKEAEHQAALFEEQIRNGLHTNGKIKFATFVENWMKDYAEQELKPKTVARYKGLLIRINQSIGHLPIEKIRPQHLLKFYASLRETAPDSIPYRCTVNFKTYLKTQHITQVSLSKSANVSVAVLGNVCRGKNISKATATKICKALNTSTDDLFRPVESDRVLSPTTVQHYHRLISDVLNDAVAWQCIPYNPCTRIEAPKGKSSNVSYLDEVQSKKLLFLLRKEPGYYQRTIALYLLTGLRRGELLGAEWSDIDFSNKTMWIKRASHYLPQKGIYTDTPKNKSSERLVMISDQVVQLLQKQFCWQQNQRKLFGNRWVHSNRIITAPDGSPMHPDRITKWFKRFIKKTDLPQIHLHCLRHTYATLCIAKGMPLTAVAEQLGHASVATTAKIYAHAIKSAQISATNTIGDLFDEDL